VEKIKQSIEKDPIITLETKGYAVCEHCRQIQAHEVLGKDGSCDNCGKLVRKGLF